MRILLLCTWSFLAIYMLYSFPEIPSTLKAAALISYINSSGGIIKVGKLIQRFLERLIDCKKSWEYLQEVGQQTFPV